MSIRQSDTAYPQGVNQRRDCPIHTKEMKQENFDVFKNCTGEVTATDEELSYCDGLLQSLNDHRDYFPATTSGVSYVITPSPAYTSISDGFRFCIKADQNNSASPTITVNSLTAISLVDYDGSALEADDIVANKIFVAIYIEAQSYFQLLKL